MKHKYCSRHQPQVVGIIDTSSYGMYRVVKPVRVSIMHPHQLSLKI